MFEPKLKEELEYFLWELPSMKDSEGTWNGKAFNLKDREQFIEFVLLQL